MILKLFCVNFKNYKAQMQDKSKNWNQDIDLLPAIDGFNHTQNLKARMDFVNTLILNNIWRTEHNDPIYFLYEILIENSISVKDKNEYFNWIMNLLEQKEKNEDKGTEDKIFKIFNEKICKDQESCKNLSIQAFESYLKVFLNVNSSNNYLYVSKYIMNVRTIA